MKKKLLTVLLIVVIVFNFICTSNVYADPDDVVSTLPESNGEPTMTPEQVQEQIDNGKDSSGNSPSIGSTLIGLIFQSISLMLNSFPMTVQALMTQLARNPSGADNPLEAVNDFVMDLVDLSSYFTIQRTVFNEVWDSYVDGCNIFQCLYFIIHYHHLTSHADSNSVNRNISLN